MNVSCLGYGPVVGFCEDFAFHIKLGILRLAKHVLRSFSRRSLVRGDLVTVLATDLQLSFEWKETCISD
jgi:hypothetical protein